MSSTLRSMGTYKEKNVYLDENDSRKSYKQIRVMNMETGDFWEFDDSNLVLRTHSYSDYSDPDLSHQWYRKMAVSHSKANQIENGMSDNAKKFTNEDKTKDADPFSTQLVWEGRITSNQQKTDLVYLVFDHGMNPLTLAYGSPMFMKFFSDPRNRMRFYIRLLALLKRMVEKLNRRLCTFAPSAIGLTKRVSEEDGSVQFYPVYREFYNAVKLDEKCKSYQKAYNPTSVTMGPLETEEKYLQRVEVFSVGMIIHYLESHFAFGAFQNYGEESDVPDWVASLKPSDELAETMVNQETQAPQFSMRDIFTKALETETAYRGLEETTSNTYSNKASKNNLRFIRQACGKYFELNPIVTVTQNVSYKNCMGFNASTDANGYLLEVYNDFFTFVDSMTNQNNTTLYQRPTYDEGIAKISEFLEKFESILQQIPVENLTFTEQQRLLI